MHTFVSADVLLYYFIDLKFYYSIILVYYFILILLLFISLKSESKNTNYAWSISQKCSSHDPYTQSFPNCYACPRRPLCALCNVDGANAPGRKNHSRYRLPGGLFRLCKQVFCFLSGARQSPFHPFSLNISIPIPYMRLELTLPRLSRAP